MRGGRQKPDGPPPSSHTAIINEYDTLFVHRDGRPTLASQKEFDYLLGPQATPEQRFELAAYVLAGLTEIWRAHRNYAGVMYLAYLDGDVPNAVTCDNFRDIRRLVLDPYFADYVGNAFKPLGVYVNFWHPELPCWCERSYRVMMVNDEHQPAHGRLELVWESASGGRVSGRAEQTFDIPALGQARYDIELTAPSVPGPDEVKALAFWDGKPWSPTPAAAEGCGEVGPACRAGLWATDDLCPRLRFLSERRAYFYCYRYPELILGGVVRGGREGLCRRVPVVRRAPGRWLSVPLNEPEPIEWLGHLPFQRRPVLGQGEERPTVGGRAVAEDNLPCPASSCAVRVLRR